MGVCALAHTLTTLYLAQLLNGLATACLWTAVYTLTADLTPAATHGEAFGRVDEYAHRGGLYGMGLALAFLSWGAQDTALRALFVSYMALGGLAVVVAWRQVPETRTVPSPQPRRQISTVWPLVPVLLLVLLSYLLTALLRPVYVVFLHDELTHDIRLLALAPQKALISDLTEETTRGTAYGLHTFATSLGSAVGPVVGGWIYETWGHTTPFMLTGLILLASLAWVPLLLRGQPAGRAPRHDEPKAFSP
jgi:predicted MFS family arabinose efflux permease